MEPWTAWKAVTVSACVLAVGLVVVVLWGRWVGADGVTKDAWWLHQTHGQAKAACTTEWHPYTPLPPRTPDTLWEHRRDAFCLLYGEAPP